MIQTLANVSALSELVIEENPCTKRFMYKYDLLWSLRLVKLDREVVTGKDYELSKNFNLQKENIQQANNGGGSNNPFGQNDATQRPTTSYGKAQSRRLEMSLRDQEIERKISSLEQQLQQYKATVEELSQDKE